MIGAAHAQHPGCKLDIGQVGFKPACRRLACVFDQVLGCEPEREPPWISADDPPLPRPDASRSVSPCSYRT